jgi:predicted glycogen debranching enzyme
MIDIDGYVTVDGPGVGSSEWLVSNGLGSYASGTVSQLLSRRYHGLLVAAVAPPLGRTVLLSKVDETVEVDGAEFLLSTNRWNEAGSELAPTDFDDIAGFRLDGSMPVWHFALGDVVLEKRVWMERHEDTTYVRYQHRSGNDPIHLSVKALVNYRDFHSNTHGGDWRMSINSVDSGIRVEAFSGAAPFVVRCAGSSVTPNNTWYLNHFLDAEAYRGLDPLGDDLFAAQFDFVLQPGEAATVVASTNVQAETDGDVAIERQRSYEAGLVSGHLDAPGWIRQLIVAADQFIVQRPAADGSVGATIIAGYHWFGDWGRDTMISLPGIALVTGRPDIAASILRTFAQYVDRGMLPNRFPDAGDEPEYNTVDATLWYFEAIRAYHAATEDDRLVADLFPLLQDIIGHHLAGTRYGIGVDPVDGLLSAGEPQVQLTWMDAKVDDWVVTPRIGKPVEINALWFSALTIAADFAHKLEDPSEGRFRNAAERVGKSFDRFWNTGEGYCFDVIDGPIGTDGRLRPNQLLAVSLPHSPLPAERQKQIVDVCQRELVTPMGLRTLSPADVDYVGRYGGGPRERDGAYHQGTVWPWLLGPFVTAHHRVYGDPTAALGFLSALREHLGDHGLGTIAEIADGDPPHAPRGAIAQAWSVAEVLRTWTHLTTLHERNDLDRETA